MNNLSLTKEMADSVAEKLLEAGYKKFERKQYHRYSKGRADATYIHYSLNIIRATRNTDAQKIITNTFGAPNGWASDSQDDRYCTWFFNGYNSKEGASKLGEKVYSWVVKSENTVCKLVDKTLRKDKETGVPKEIIDFFISRKLEKGAKTEVALYVGDKGFEAEVMLKPDGRHKLKLNAVAAALDLSLLHEGEDTVWFERDDDGGFYVYTKSLTKSLSKKPKSRTKPTRTSSKGEGERRIGQDYFRSEVIDACNRRCVVTAVDDISLLIASHIKPWAKSSDDEKMDGDNGLLLAPHIDKLFDKGRITFSELGEILIADDLSDSVLDAWHIDKNKKYSLNENQRRYMAYHRESIFNK